MAAVLHVLAHGPCRTNGRSRWEEEGDVVGASVIARDAAEPGPAGTALRQSEADFRQLAEALPQMVWITRPDLLLAKPFTALALLRRVREALGERGRGENA